MPAPPQTHSRSMTSKQSDNHRTTPERNPEPKSDVSHTCSRACTHELPHLTTMLPTNNNQHHLTTSPSLQITICSPHSLLRGLSTQPSFRHTEQPPEPCPREGTPPPLHTPHHGLSAPDDRVSGSKPSPRAAQSPHRYRPTLRPRCSDCPDQVQQQPGPGHRPDGTLAASLAHLLQRLCPDAEVHGACDL